MPNRRISFVSTSIICSLVFVSAAAQDNQTVSLNPVKDNTLYESETGALSDGQGEAIFAGRTNATGGTAARRAVLAFDLSAIPAGSTISAVSLQLQNSSTRNNGTFTLSLHRLTKDWGEGASNASGQEGGGTSAAAGDATWIHTFYDTDFWDSPGGDFVATPSAENTVGANGSYTWQSNGMIDDVQAWVDDPSSNFGWILIGDESSGGTAKRFNSREAAGEQPLLSVAYAATAGDLSFKSFFPQFGNGGGFFSQIVLLNSGNESTATVRIVGHTDNGNPYILSGGDALDTIVEVPPNGLRVFETGPQGELQLGSVTISADADIRAVIVFGGSFGLAGVQAAEDFSQGFAGPVDTQFPLVRTGVSIQNLNPDPVSVPIDLLDSDGAVVASALLDIAGLGKTAQFVDEIEWDTPVDFSSFRGSIRVTGQTDLSAVMIQNRTVDGVSQFATLPVVALPETPVGGNP